MQHLPAFCALLAVVACSSDPTVTVAPPPAPPPPPPSNIVTASVDGASWTSDSVWAHYDSKLQTLSVGGYSSNPRIAQLAIWVENISGPGGIQLLGLSRELRMAGRGDTAWNTSSVSSAFNDYSSSVSITTLTTTRVAGTFSAQTSQYQDVYKGSDARFIRVTQGTFDLAIH